MTDSAVRTTQSRTPTHVDALAEAYLDSYAALNPTFATAIGLSGYDAELPDLSPAGLDARADLDQRTLALLAAAHPADDVDKVTIAAMTERLDVSSELHA